MLSLKTGTQALHTKWNPTRPSRPLQAPPPVRSCPILLLLSKLILHPHSPSALPNFWDFQNLLSSLSSGAFVLCSLCQMPTNAFAFVKKTSSRKPSLILSSPTSIHLPSWLAASPESSLSLCAYAYVKCGLIPYTCIDYNPYFELEGRDWGSYLSWHFQTYLVCRSAHQMFSELINGFLWQLHCVTQFLQRVDHPLLWRGVKHPPPEGLSVPSSMPGISQVLRKHWWFG